MFPIAFFALGFEYFILLTENQVLWIFFFFWLCHAADGILSPRLGIEP